VTIGDLWQQRGVGTQLLRRLADRALEEGITQFTAEILSENRAMLAVVITTVWWTVGFNFLLYLAALQGIPAQIYEAAAIDGANRRQKLFRITLPLLSRTTGLIVVLQLVASLMIFDQIYLMTDGGPNYATRPIVQYIYQNGFTNYRIGYASAISYLFFVIIVIVSVLQFKLFSGRKEVR